MARVVVTEFLTLDGVMESPSWSAPFWSDEIAHIKAEEQRQAGALLLGRVTYQAFAAAWPGRTDPGADFMNSVPKHVATTTLGELTWQHSRLLLGHTAEAVRALKAQDGGDLLVYGSATLVATLMEHDLVDLYRLLVYPLVLGEGRRLFGEGHSARLKLTESRPLPKGVHLLCYEPDRESPNSR